MRRAHCWVAVASALFVASAAWAVGAAPAMLLPGEKVQSTFGATGDVKLVAFAGVEGSTLTVSAKALKGSRVVPSLTLFSPSGVLVDLGDTNPKSGPKAKAAGVPLGATGTWRIGIGTPVGAGGAFELSVAAKVPLKTSWTGALDGVLPYERVVPAAAGGSITISVTVKEKPASGPVVELISPAGEPISRIEGTKGRAAFPPTRLDATGRYTVRISGAAGTFTARTVVKPGAKRTLEFGDVESTPEIRGVSPTTTGNDAIVRFTLDGFAFSTRHNVSLIAAGGTKAAGPIDQANAAGATCDIDLADVAPGTYAVRVTTPGGNSTTAADSVVVTNRTPLVYEFDPAEASGRLPFPLDVRGTGFDAAAALTVRRASDGIAIPLVVTSRTGHERIQATATVPTYVTGPCDIEVRDPDGGSATLPGGLDLLGFRTAPVTLRRYTGATANLDVYPRDSAFDTVNSRALIALQEKTNAVFLLVDPVTMTVVDTLVLTGADFSMGTATVQPRCAFDAVTGTFALTCVVGPGNARAAAIRIVAAADLHDTKVQKTFVTDQKYVTQVTAAANAETGGYLVVFDRNGSTATAARIVAQVVTPTFVIDTATETDVAVSSTGAVWDPAVAFQGNGRFVVAWAGKLNDNVTLALHATVLDAAGVQTFDAGPLVPASAASWKSLVRPSLTRHPADGSMMLGFTVTEVSFLRPMVQRLAAVSAEPGTVRALDDDGGTAQSSLDTIRWNPERSEFVATLTTVASRVIVRRVSPDGSIHPAPVVESYEGVSGVVYSGPAAGQLGLVRGFDGLADDVHTGTMVMETSMAPLR